MGKLKKYFCLLIAVLLLASVIPSVALADDPVASPTEAQSNEIYVSAPSENGQNNESVLTAKKGTRENPYETLADAAEAINKTKNQDYTIYIMSDLIMTKSARFWDNDVSIQSDLVELKHLHFLVQKLVLGACRIQHVVDTILH